MSLCWKKRDMVTLSIVSLASWSARTAAQEAYVATVMAAGRFPLAAAGKPATVIVSGADYAGVIRAANDLRADLGRVTGNVANMSTDTVPRARDVVVVGTLGKSPIIDRLVRDKKFDARD